jgi:hypothetical protein
MRIIIYNILKFCEVEINCVLTIPVSKQIENVNPTAQIRKQRTPVFRFYRIWAVPVFFLPLFKTADPTAIFPGQLTVLPGIA